MLGNAGPYGLPSTPLSALIDPRTYYGGGWTSGQAGPGSTFWTPIGPQGASGATGPLSPYARVIAATPGLVHWWRMGKAITPVPSGAQSSAPYFANAAGATTLRSIVSGGTPVVVPGLLPGDKDGAVKLNGGYLDAYDYFVQGTGTHEVMSAEIWVYFTSTPPGDSAIMGEWSGSNGWMLYQSSGTLKLYITAATLTSSVTLVANKLYHIVGVWGGNEPPTPNYHSRIYVNGVDTGNANLIVTTGTTIDTVASRFQIGQYSNGGGTNNLPAIVDEAAVYSRMLQPAEVQQHYQAAFQRL